MERASRHLRLSQTTVLRCARATVCVCVCALLFATPGITIVFLSFCSFFFSAVEAQLMKKI